MLSKNRSTVRTADTKDRTSTGIEYPPSIPVDDVERVSENISSNTVCPANDPPEWSDSQLSSLELLRQLETCVRELLEVNSKGR
jgi:hypothetical protein